MSQALTSPDEPVQVNTPQLATLAEFEEFQNPLELPRTARATLWVLVALILGAIAWGLLSKVDIVVSAEGKLATDSQLTVVQPFELSVIRDMTVKVGDTVKAGQVMATLDPTITSADAEEARQRLATDRAKLNRMEVELSGRTYAPTNPNPAEAIEIDVFAKRDAELKARAASTDVNVKDLEGQLATKRLEAPALADQLKALQEEERIYQTLFEAGNGSKLKLLDAKRSSSETAGRLVTNDGDQKSLVQQIASAKADYTTYASQRQRELSEDYVKTRSDYEETASKLAKATMRGKLTYLTAPVDGTVLDVAPRANGSVLREAETVVTLVPASAQMEADIQIETRDIGRVKVGDEVTLKLESMPFQQYGSITGRLIVLTPDTLDESGSSGSQQNGTTSAAQKGGGGGGGRQHTYYRGRVRFEQNKLRGLPDSFVLRPGMKVTADINVGSRSSSSTS